MFRKSSPSSVILLDPHGDVASECARQNSLLREYRIAIKEDRPPNIAFLSPTLERGYLSSLNPFDLHGQHCSFAHLEILAQFLTSAFASMLGQENISLSHHMKTILTPLFTVLLVLSEKNSQPTTFFDLERFLDDERNADLIMYAIANAPSTGLRHFFRHLYLQKRFQTTKFALQTRLAGLLNMKMFTDLFCVSHSSWNLQKLMNSGTSILIDVSAASLGATVSQIYGRTVTALVQGYAFQRTKSQRKKSVFFLIDEAASFISSDITSMLTQSRKFGIHLILANQLVKQGGMGSELHETIMGNTGLKVLGNSGSASRLIMAKEFECSADLLKNLSVGQFVLKLDNGKPPRKIILPKFWLGDKTTMSAKRWCEVKPLFLKHFYRSRKPTSSHVSQLKEEITAHRESIHHQQYQVGNPRPQYS